MRRLCLLLVVSAFVAGCSSLGQPVTDFRAYYNTFYNAQNAFEDGLDAIEDRDQEVDPERYITLFHTPDDAAGEQHFEEAIEWSADILREHPDSRWVDDALMIIGQSEFYLGNQAGAAEKFREVIALDEGREGEAHFWLARTLLAAGDPVEAIEHVEEATQTDDHGEWAALMDLVRGEAQVRAERWEEAARALTDGLTDTPRPEVAARAAFLLGQVHEMLDQPARAAAAYEQVREHRPTYELELEAGIRGTLMQSHAGDTGEALQAIREMEGDDRFFEDRLRLKLTRAQLLRADGQYAAAHQAFETLVYGDDPASGDVLGQAHYEWGTLYQEVERDYVEAAAHFDTAASRLGGGAGDDVQATPAALRDVDERAERFGVLADRSVAVTRLDSLLQLGALDDEAFQAFVEELEEQAEADRTEEAAPAAGFDGGEQMPPDDELEEQAADGDAFAAAGAATTAEDDAGFLFHNDPGQVQELEQRFERRWGPRPRVPNWRRVEAVTAFARAIEEEEDDVDDEFAEEVEDLQPEEELQPDEQEPAVQAQIDIRGRSTDISEVPRDAQSQAAMEEELATARYELGNALFFVAEEPDSARVWYQRVLDETPDHPVSQRALYALAEAHAALDQTADAREFYQRLIDNYPASDFADRAREQLGDVDPEPQATERAEEAYRAAYADWGAGTAHDAFTQMVDVAQDYPDTEVAPRALFAAATIVLEELKDASILSLDRSATALLAQHEAEGHRPIGDAEPTAKALAEVLLTHLADRYPDAPQADRAGRIAQALIDDRTPDDVLADLPEGALGAGIAPNDTMAIAGRGDDASSDDEDAAEEDTTDGSAEAIAGPGDVNGASEADEEETADPASEAIDRAAGGWTLAVATGASREAAEDSVAARRATLREDEDTDALVDLLPVAGGSAYQVVVGQYLNEDRAEQARTEHAERAGEEAEVIPIRPPADIADRSDDDAGRWSIVVASHPADDVLEDVVMQYRALVSEQFEEDWPVDIERLIVEGRDRYRVLLGQFEQQAAAEEARDRYEENLPDNAWLIQIEDDS